jgi:hypothetical protein
MDMHGASTVLTLMTPLKVPLITLLSVTRSTVVPKLLLNVVDVVENVVDVVDAEAAVARITTPPWPKLHHKGRIMLGTKMWVMHNPVALLHHPLLHPVVFTPGVAEVTLVITGHAVVTVDGAIIRTSIPMTLMSWV